MLQGDTRSAEGRGAVRESGEVRSRGVSTRTSWEAVAEVCVGGGEGPAG